jgi:hypothetical protein
MSMQVLVISGYGCYLENRIICTWTTDCQVPSSWLAGCSRYCLASSSSASDHGLADGGPEYHEAHVSRSLTVAVVQHVPQECLTS